MRGKTVILLILAMALLATAGSWWYRYQAGRRALVFWGPEAARRIRQAPQVQLFRLSRDAPGDPRPPVEKTVLDSRASAEQWLERGLAIDGVHWPVDDWRDVSRAAGAVHARHSLIEDSSFLWDQPRGECQVCWTHAWRFVDASGQTVVLLDLACDRIRQLGSTREVSLKFGDGLRTFCDEQFQR